MSLGRKYFLLKDVLPKTEIPHLVGRVVLDKTHPSQAYAPFSHNPEDIVKDLLPAPVVWASGNDFISNTTGWKVTGGFSDIIQLGRSRSTENGASIESEEVSCYTMPNTMLAFEELMKNTAYSKDIHDILRRSNTGHAYFVTGFLTCRNGVLSVSRVESQHQQVGATAPILQAPASNFGRMGNPNLSFGFEKTQKKVLSRQLVDNVIFAVAYDVIRSSRSLDLDSRFFVKTSIINKGPKRVKPNHLAFMRESDSDSDSEDSASDNEEISYVNTELLGDERFDTVDLDAVSFHVKGISKDLSI
ncbi:hypothetical protein B0J13DRAFT_58593 [Dactylonectria estremocensis]|uniref:Uncharacterized protein n=1 Tax=Dactylonectria estremocensis TaxID=1079267 RepID=A0A9P9EKX9_9HYPO|nr:hypothetical protein B0J13DRAFT_58593 [Dactylonectria estremocensis]